MKDINPKSSSFVVCFPLYPLMLIRVDFNNANLNLVLINDITTLYCSFLLCANNSAILLLSLRHSGAIPPLVEKTKGVKELFSTFYDHCTSSFSHFHFACRFGPASFLCSLSTSIKTSYSTSSSSCKIFSSNGFLSGSFKMAAWLSCSWNFRQRDWTKKIKIYTHVSIAQLLLV